MDLEKLKDLVDYLRSVGANAFTGFGVSISFFPEEYEPASVSTKEETVGKKITSIWDNPTLWPGGEPPKFPGK